MIKKICLIITCLLPLVGYAVERNSEEKIKMIDSQENLEGLRAATDTYIKFINQIGQGEVFSQTEVASKIISLNCKKILNGQLFTQNREEFVADLFSVYENQGPWKITPVDMIIESSSNTAVIRIIIEMEKIGTYTAIVILRYDSNYLIYEINEVLNQVKGSYDF